MGTHARLLAEWLADRSDAELSALWTARHIDPRVDWTDFFDAAEALLDPASLAKTLPRLTRDQAATLIGAENSPDATHTLQNLALFDAEARPYPEVAAAIAGREVPAASASEPAGTVGDADAAHAAERAVTHVAAIAEALLTTRETPLALLTTGAVSAVARRRFADQATVPQDADLDDLISHAVAARLAVAEDRLLQLTARGAAWLQASAPERWAWLAEGFRETLPTALRTSEGGWLPLSAWHDIFCWDPEWGETYARLLRRGRQLGLFVAGDRETPWAVPLREGHAANASILQQLLPAEVDKIFLQNDLTAIAPGPLAATLDMRLRALAVRESAAQASSYRFTAESIAHALALGETEQSLTEFLGELSLTGIPQPLTYLISQTAARHGLVRVSAADHDRLTRVRSSDSHLLETIRVDQALHPLGLVRYADELRSKVNATTVFWALSDARYPATLLDPDGEPIIVGRGRIVETPEETPDATDYSPLIERLRARQGPDADAAWLERALESAVQERAVLRVEVAMPDGSTRALTLEATGIGGGRLRGLDRAADVERTLPVRSIRSATPVAESAH